MDMLSSEFAMKDLGPLYYFLHISITRFSSSLLLSQMKYVQEIIDHSNMTVYKPSSTPIDTNSKLSATTTTEYYRLVGALQYLIFTLTNICYAIQQVCLFMHDPHTPHFTALKHIIRYLKGTLSFGLHLYSSSIHTLLSYTDAD